MPGKRREERLTAANQIGPIDDLGQFTQSKDGSTNSSTLMSATLSRRTTGTVQASDVMLRELSDLIVSVILNQTHPPTFQIPLNSLKTIPQRRQSHIVQVKRGQCCAES